MLKSKTMVLFIILMLGVVYMGTTSNTDPKNFVDESDNITVIYE